jgi:hypothetical protein
MFGGTQLTAGKGQQKHLANFFFEGHLREHGVDIYGHCFLLLEMGPSPADRQRTDGPARATHTPTVPRAVPAHDGSAWPGHGLNH